ncbi:F0F1 ATP synthase subunit gamma [Georgenia sp. Z1491]|uniref:F0F1 ATP synthase subunit gamma n=1 Tax=Georgenia sp. Z1491 TaxID=3416707 RepID=UPI003CF9DC22
MAGQQRVYKQKIRATQTLKKVFRAMELIAASRIGKARDAALGSDPYTAALIRAVSAVASHADLDHPLISGRDDTTDVAVLVVTSDRGMAGAYSATVLREAERLLEELEAEGKTPRLYVFGRRGESYFKFRGREVVATWTGESDSPSVAVSQEIAQTLLGAYRAEPGEGGVSELHVVFTRFQSMVTQVVQRRRVLPLEVVEGVAEPTSKALPLYEFEPSPEDVLDQLLPMYVSNRIRAQLLMAAASELASRQRAMHTATENAEDIIRDYTRLANQARQGEITQEISEIVSGVDALSAS